MVYPYRSVSLTHRQLCHDGLTVRISQRKFNFYYAPRTFYALARLSGAHIVWPWSLLEHFHFVTGRISKGVGSDSKSTDGLVPAGLVLSNGNYK